MSEFRTLGEVLQLNYPQSVGVFDTYGQAQEAVDYLSDQEFAVENLQIVGTDLKSIERVTGRLTWASVAGQGFVSGIGLGIFVGAMLYIFSGGHSSFWALMGLGALMGGLFAMFTAMLLYGFTGGRRDFESMRQVVAGSYEVQAEHKVAEEARRLLANRGAVVQDQPTSEAAAPAAGAAAASAQTEPVLPPPNAADQVAVGEPAVADEAPAVDTEATEPVEGAVGPAFAPPSEQAPVVDQVPEAEEVSFQNSDEVSFDRAFEEGDAAAEADELLGNEGPTPPPPTAR